MAAQGKNRKYGRQERSPSHKRYVMENRCSRNKEKNIKRDAVLKAAKAEHPASHGGWRAIRRKDMANFKKWQRYVNGIKALSTITTCEIKGKIVAPAKNNNLHDVASVTRMRDGRCVVRTYKSSMDYPANVVCQFRPHIYTYNPMTYGKAKETADRINQIH